MFDPSMIDAVFEEHRDQQYARKILFSTLVHVMFEVVSSRTTSVHAAAQARKDTLGASITALYDKLNHTEPRVVEQLVAASYSRAYELVRSMGGLRAEPLPGYRLRILDGNHLGPLPSGVWRPSGRSPRGRCPAWRWWSSTTSR